MFWVQRRFPVDSTWIPPRVGTCAGVKAVAWSPDGRKLATGGAGSSGGISGGKNVIVVTESWQISGGDVFGDVFGDTVLVCSKF